MQWLCRHFPAIIESDAPPSVAPEYFFKTVSPKMTGGDVDGLEADANLASTDAQFKRGIPDVFTSSKNI